MFAVSETEAAAIRSAFNRGGKLSAAVELRRLFPAITDNVQARECARTIAGWKPLPNGAVPSQADAPTQGPGALTQPRRRCRPMEKPTLKRCARQIGKSSFTELPRQCWQRTLPAECIDELLSDGP
jgi:hypothetical protein